MLAIDVGQGLAGPLDDVFEPEISRRFGGLVSEDDFSATGDMGYKPASIAGKIINMDEISSQLREVARMMAEASRERDRISDQKGLDW